MGKSIKIQNMREEHVPTLAKFYQQYIPNAIFSALGVRFTVNFFKRLIDLPDMCSLVATNPDGTVQGVIVGTLHRSRNYASVLRAHRWSLLAAAGWRLLSPSVLSWIFRGVLERLTCRREEVDLPDTELLLIALYPEFRGTGLAEGLVEAMEARFCEMGFFGPYVIRTEADNMRANRFYERLGIALVATQKYRGLLINCYQKYAEVPSGNKESDFESI